MVMKILRLPFLEEECKKINYFEVFSRFLGLESFDPDPNDLTSESNLEGAYRLIWFSQMSW